MPAFAHASSPAAPSSSASGAAPAAAGADPSPASGGAVRARGTQGAIEAATDPIDFATIYDQYFDFVWRTARRLGVPPRNVDDAAQDVFIVVHRRLASFEGRSSVKTWLYGITRRVARDHRRRIDRKEKHLVPADGLADAAAGNPREQAARAEAVATLHAFLDSLDDDKREAFVLAELEQMTVPEIAELAEANTNTVYSRLRAARAAFEKFLARARARRESRGEQA